ncbi:MAG: hypothetical protein EHM24_32145, partial [Acidobacteria bacterium]
MATATPLPGASVGAVLQPCLAAATCLLLAFALCVACASGPPRPATLDTANDACSHCRMAVSDRHFAAQIVAAGEEPLFFDDLGCLRSYVREHREMSPRAAIYVADHRTTDWVEGRMAVYTLTP